MLTKVPILQRDLGGNCFYIYLSVSFLFDLYEKSDQCTCVVARGQRVRLWSSSTNTYAWYICPHICL